MQEPVLGCQDRPLRLENFKKSSQGLLDVFGVHGFALGEVVRVNDALRVEEDEDHLLGPGRVDFCFSRAWQTLLNPLFGPPLRFRGVEGYGRLVHGSQCCPGPPTNAAEEAPRSRRCKPPSPPFAPKTKAWGPNGRTF